MVGIGYDIEVVKKYVGVVGMEMLFKILNFGVGIIWE